MPQISPAPSKYSYLPRHTYASLLIEQGENIKYIQNQLGLANPTVTLNIYANLIKETNQASAKRLEDTIKIPTDHKIKEGHKTKKRLTV